MTSRNPDCLSHAAAGAGNMASTVSTPDASRASATVSEELGYHPEPAREVFGQALPTPLMRHLHRARILFEAIRPAVDQGRYPIKRELGEVLTVEADVFREGHDVLSVRLLYRHEHDRVWHEVPMRPLGNDRWTGEFRLEKLGEYYYTLAAWTDTFASWLDGVRRKVADGQDVRSDLLEGAAWLRQTAAVLSANQSTSPSHVPGNMTQDGTQAAPSVHTFPLFSTALTNESTTTAPADAARELQRIADELERLPQEEAMALVQQPQLLDWLQRWQPRLHYCVHEPALRVIVDRRLACFAAWYELFPRSASPVPGRHGTFRDVQALLPELHDLGFDVLYFPPIHPIGRTHRKGKNNSPVAGPDDPGSPWAIGNEYGGHTAIEPQLGTLDDFRELVRAAASYGIEIALDFAIQCSPDHPYVRQHPEWFRHRPDGTIKYAENPPKKYQDIYPLDFDSPAWAELWYEWRRVLRFWIMQGVRIFRVDNPHTKPIRFWEWLLREIKREFPEVIFLSEAFTRPKIMKALAKVGFTQSYTYFAWRNTRRELVEYLTELTQTEMAEYFRPSFWPNTPDILTEYLQTGGRPAFKIRLVLAATLSPLYGIYSGYEFCENVPLRPGSEEISPLRKIRNQTSRSQRSRQHQGFHSPDQSLSPTTPRPATVTQSTFPRDHQRPVALLQQGNRRFSGCGAGGRQPRPTPTAGGCNAIAVGRAWFTPRRAFSGGRRPDGFRLALAWCRKLRSTRPAAGTGSPFRGATRLNRELPGFIIGQIFPWFLLLLVLILPPGFFLFGGASKPGPFQERLRENLFFLKLFHSPTRTDYLVFDTEFPLGDLQLIPGSDDFLADDPVAVDLGAVGAVEVFHPPVTFLVRQLGVHGRNIRKLQADVARIAATNDHAVAHQRNLVPTAQRYQLPLDIGCHDQGLLRFAENESKKTSQLI
jgi:starch synthase (maltosyl-transferring)